MKVPHVWIVKIRRSIGHDSKTILVFLRKSVHGWINSASLSVKKKYTAAVRDALVVTSHNRLLVFFFYVSKLIAEQRQTTYHGAYRHLASWGMQPHGDLYFRLQSEYTEQNQNHVCHF